MAHKIMMVTEIATKDFIKWMKFWLNIPNYVGSKAREGKLEKAEVTLSRAKIEKGAQKVKKDLFDLICFWFTKQRHLKKFCKWDNLSAYLYILDRIDDPHVGKDVVALLPLILFSFFCINFSGSRMLSGR